MARPSKYDREAVADAIMRTFWEHGYEATSLDRLEKATGLKRTSLYNAFGDKEAMFTGALERYQTTIGDPLIAALEHEDPHLGLRAHFAAQQELLSDLHNPHGCFASAASSELGAREDSLGALVQAKTNDHAAALTDAFARWQKAGKVSPEADPARLAALLMALTNGTSTLRRAGADSPLAQHAYDAALSAFDQWLRPA